MMFVASVSNFTTRCALPLFRTGHAHQQPRKALGLGQDFHELKLTVMNIEVNNEHGKLEELAIVVLHTHRHNCTVDVGLIH